MRGELHVPMVGGVEGAENCINALKLDPENSLSSQNALNALTADVRARTACRVSPFNRTINCADPVQDEDIADKLVWNSVDSLFSHEFS